MLMIEDAEERTVPILPKLIPPIRQALVSEAFIVLFAKFTLCLHIKIFLLVCITL